MSNEKRGGSKVISFGIKILLLISISNTVVADAGLYYAFTVRGPLLE
jgi:hypothetical protein